VIKNEAHGIAKEVRTIIRHTADSLKMYRDKFVRGLASREYRPLWHLLSVLFIIVAACFLFYKNFPPHGTIMYTDMTWPNTLNHLQFNAANTWMIYGSYPIGGSQLWFYWIYPSAAVARFLHISASGYMFIMFLGTFSLAGISMYALAYSTIKSIKLPNATRYAPHVGAVLAALIFMYNPWSLMYLREYFGYPMYALSPLLFLVMVKTFDSPTLKNIVLFSLFVVLINTSHHIVWFWALFISYLLFFVITNRFRKEKLKAALKVLGGTVVFYVLLGAAWIAPYAGSLFANKPLLPYYSPAFSPASVQGLSAHNTMVNNFRLVSFWSWTLKTVKGGVFAEVLLFALPVLAILSFLVMRKHIKRNRIVNYWATVAVLALLLATGTSFILKHFYLYITTNAPGSSFYGWMLRASEKWLFFVPVFYALTIGILAAHLLKMRTGSRSLRRLTAVVVLMVLLAVSLYPVALWFSRTIFNPADVPKDYQQVNDFLAKKPDGTRVVWIPFFSKDAYTYKWAPEKKIGPYSILSSNPSLSSIQEIMNDNSYYNWLELLYLKQQIPPVLIMSPELVLKKDEMSRLLTPFGARYLIFDKSVKGHDFGESFTNEKSLKLVYETKYLRVYRIDNDPEYISATATTAKVNSFFDNLSVTQRLLKEGLESPAFFDGRSFFGGASNIAEKYGAVDINQYLIPLTPYGGFEQSKANDQPEGWYLTYDNGKTKLSLVTDTKAEGKRSLKVTNESSRAYDISWVSTWENPVQAGDIYTFETNVKYRNAKWSSARLEGYQQKTRQWIPLIACPGLGWGDSGWKKYQCSICIPEGITWIRPALGAGWKSNRHKGPAVTWFDGVNISKVKNEFISSITQNNKPPQVSYGKVNPAEYRVQVRGATKPFILTLAETYDGLWVAETRGGKKIESVPMYATINGFPIDKTGDFELTVKYRPQSWLSLGFAISFVTIFLCLACLLYFWRARLIPGSWRKARGPRGRMRD